MAFRSVKRYRRTRQEPSPRDDIESQIARGSRGGGSRSSQDEDESSSRSGRNERRPLGDLPDGFTALGTRTGMYSARGGETAAAMGRQPGTTGPARPRYYDGDQFKPASEGFEAIIYRQRALIVGGYLGADAEFVFGRWDESTRNAYEDLLTDANIHGLTADAMLQQSAMGTAALGGGQGGGGGGGGGRGQGGGYTIDPNTGELVPEPYVAPALELRTYNKADLTAAFRKGIVEIMGEGWNDAQINEMVDAYNWKAIQVQKEAYDRTVAIDRAQWEGTSSPSGGEIIDTGVQPGGGINIESPETFLENELQRRDPAGVAEGRTVNEWIPQFMSYVKGWV